MSCNCHRQGSRLLSGSDLRSSTGRRRLLPGPGGPVRYQGLLPEAPIQRSGTKDGQACQLNSRCERTDKVVIGAECHSTVTKLGQRNKALTERIRGAGYRTVASW